MSVQLSEGNSAPNRRFIELRCTWVNPAVTERTDDEKMTNDRKKVDIVRRRQKYQSNCCATVVPDWGPHQVGLLGNIGKEVPLVRGKNTVRELSTSSHRRSNTRIDIHSAKFFANRLKHTATLIHHAPFVSRSLLFSEETKSLNADEVLEITGRGRP